MSSDLKGFNFEKYEILEVPFPHPRDRHAILESKEYNDLRLHALDFLERYQ